VEVEGLVGVLEARELDNLIQEINSWEHYLKGT